jgi:hypothetical protein
MVVVEAASTGSTGPIVAHVVTLQRLYREVTRMLGARGYAMGGIGHSIFNLQSHALDLTYFDLCLLRLMYHPRLTPGMSREVAMTTAASILGANRI